MGELCGVCSEDFGENWSRYNGIALYMNTACVMAIFDAIWRQIWVNIGSGNGLLPDGTKPLPEPKVRINNIPALV